MNLYWPIALVVVSNIIYHICAKSSPESIDPFAYGYISCFRSFFGSSFLCHKPLKRSASGIFPHKLDSLYTGSCSGRA